MFQMARQVYRVHSKRDIIIIIMPTSILELLNWSVIVLRPSATVIESLHHRK